MLWRYVVPVLLVAGVVFAQPVLTPWLPPTGCSTNDVITWNGSAFACEPGTAGFSTNNTIPKGNGTGLTASGLTDNATQLLYSTNGPYFTADGSLGFRSDSNATATGFINYYGYAGGTTQFRDLVLADGKGATACTLTGSTKTLNCVGGLQVNGTSVTTTANVSGSTNTIAKFTGANTVGNSSSTDDGTTVTINPSGSIVLSAPTTASDGIVSTAADNSIGSLDYTVITATITGATNNWAPTGLSTATSIEITGDGMAEHTISGLDATDASDGQRITIRNRSGSTLLFPHQSGSSSADNRWDMTGATQQNLGNYGAFEFEYRTGIGWRQVGATSRYVASLVSLSDLSGISIQGTTIHAAGADPAVSSCGASPTIVGSNSAGRVTIGSGGPTSCTVTFDNTAGTTFNTVEPACVVTSEANNANPLYFSAKTDTAFTVSTSAGTDLSSQVFSYICIGMAP